MSKSPAIFDFKENPVRVYGTSHGPLFVAADICRVLEIGNPTQAVSRLDEDEVTLITNEGRESGNGAQQYNCVTESGLYSLIFTSRKAQAKEFKRWVTHEVLPAIRRTGSYQIPAAPAAAVQASVPAPAAPIALEDSTADWESVAERMGWLVKNRYWKMANVIRFGQLCQRLARSLSVQHKTRDVAGFGIVRIYPPAVLDMAQVQTDKHRLQYSSPGPNLNPLIAQIPDNRWISFIDVVMIARRDAVASEILGTEGDITPQMRSQFGKLLRRWVGKPVYSDSQDRSYRLLVNEMPRGCMWKTERVSSSAN